MYLCPIWRPLNLSMASQCKKTKKECDFCGSNTGPSDLQSDALPTELKPPIYRVCKKSARPYVDKIIMPYGKMTENYYFWTSNGIPTFK